MRATLAAGLALAMAAVPTMASRPAQAAAEVQFWHAMNGALGEWVQDLADGFNKTQTDYKVVPVYKGSYAETMNAAIAAFRAKQAPQIVQVFEVGTATMMSAKGAVYPVYSLMKDAGEPFDPKAYIPAVVGYYTDTAGNMLSMPLNSSTPILYYNKTAYKKAGLDPEKPPATWPELAEHAKKLQAAGTPCGFTSGWPSWVQLENLSALHNVPFGTQANGFGGLDTKFVFNGPVQVKHIAQMAEWQKSKIFDYGGRENAPGPKFYSQECAILMISSGAYANIKANSKGFDVGLGMLPYWPDVKGAPQNSIIGGATLWVLRGAKPEEYKGVAKFFSYISKPDVQAASHQRTGYLPLTQAAYELSRSQGFYDKNPGTDTAVKQMLLNPPTENSKGIRFGNMAQVRNVIEDEFEAIWSGKKTAQEGLDAAAKRGDDLLRTFERANK